MDGLVPGIGAIPNAFHALVNVDEQAPQQDGLGLHHSTDPGAGAFTPYVNRSSIATRKISAGEELYLFYGSNWFQGMTTRNCLYVYWRETSLHDKISLILFLFFFTCLLRHMFLL